MHVAPPPDGLTGHPPAEGDAILIVDAYRSYYSHSDVYNTARLVRVEVPPSGEEIVPGRPPLDSARVRSAEAAANWSYQREVRADLDGNAPTERVVIAADVVMNSVGDPAPHILTAAGGNPPLEPLYYRHYRQPSPSINSMERGTQPIWGVSASLTAEEHLSALARQLTPAASGRRYEGLVTRRLSLPREVSS